MARTLVLVRHGNPEESSASGSDFDRRLLPSGARALEVAYPRTFALLGNDPDVALWSSPAIRALQTAQVVSEALDGADIEVHDCLYAQDMQAFLAELDACPRRCVVAVGHAPFMDQLALRLSGMRVPFDKGAAAALDVSAGPGEPARLLWYVAGPTTGSWEELASVEHELSSAAGEVVEAYRSFLDDTEDPAALVSLRTAIRRMRSLLEFVSPWQGKKQARRCEHVLKDLQAATARLRGLDVLSGKVDGLVEDGELGENSLLPMACAKERALECASLEALCRKQHVGKALRKLAEDLATVSWKSRVCASGVGAEDLAERFDHMLEGLDEALFGLDLRNGDAVFAARRDAKEMQYVAERLGLLLGPERAQMSEYLDQIQSELGSLHAARECRRLAQECSKSPRFRGVRAELGVVARDQAEVVRAITSGLERLEGAGRGCGLDGDDDADPAGNGVARASADDVRAWDDSDEDEPAAGDDATDPDDAAAETGADAAPGDPAAEDDAPLADDDPAADDGAALLADDEDADVAYDDDTDDTDDDDDHDVPADDLAGEEDR